MEDSEMFEWVKYGHEEKWWISKWNLFPKIEQLIMTKIQ